MPSQVPPSAQEDHLLVIEMTLPIQTPMLCKTASQPLVLALPMMIFACEIDPPTRMLDLRDDG